MMTLHYEDYVADFETNVTPETCAANPVWAWGIAKIGCDSLCAFGTTIHSFMKYLKSMHGTMRIYFHNLKFDGAFIIDWLLNNSWVYTSDRWAPKYRGNAFTSLRANGKLYSIEFAFKDGAHVLIWDSLKKIPLSVSDMPKAFGLMDISKGEIDYSIYRDCEHKLTLQEYDYLQRDILIVSKSLEKLHEMGVDSERMSMGADAYNDWKLRAVLEFGKNTYKEMFESFANSEWIFAREAYQGGICLVNSDYKGELIYKNGVVLDVNSMYPSVMLYNAFPTGCGVWYEGEPPETGFWIANFAAHFVLKAGAQPVFHVKHYPKTYPQGVFVRDTHSELGHPLNVTMCSIDFETFSQHYDIDIVEWYGGYCYDLTEGIFTDYITQWGAVKEHAVATGNNGLKTVAKYKLNNLYGKFGQTFADDSQIPYLDSNGVVQWSAKDPTKKLTRKTPAFDDLKCEVPTSAKYMPIAVATTAYGRAKLCACIRAVGENFIYADTDSVHAFIDSTDGLDIKVDAVKLGAWDIENVFDAGKWMGAKAYAEHIDGEWCYHLAGCPLNTLKGVPIEKFEYGETYHPKLVPISVKGGVILKDVGYKFKER